MLAVPLIFLTMVASGAWIYGNFFGEIGVRGTVLDELDRAPVVGAQVALEKSSMARRGSSYLPVTTGKDGRYAIGGLSLGAVLQVEAPGYQTRVIAMPFFSFGDFDITLRPLVLEGQVRDAFSGQPLAGATVSVESRETTTDAAGRYRLLRVRRGGKLVIKAKGYAPVSQVYEGQANLEAVLRPNTLTGTVVDAESGKPIAGARVAAGDQLATTGADGSYLLTELPANPTLLVTAKGYEKMRVEVGQTITRHLQLRPFVVKAVYVTHYGIGDRKLRENVLDLIRKTELNAIVIDVKGDFSYVAYRSQVPLAEKIGALESITIPDIDALVARLKQDGVYLIARIVVFKDNLLATNGPKVGVDVTLRNRSGGPWVDNEGLVWVDPFREEVWDYNIAIAKEVAEKGFDEIQFDYIRFPTDGPVGQAVFSRPYTSENRVEAITAFLAKAWAVLKPLGVNIGVDVFGYAAWQDDSDALPIGQNIEKMAQYVDYICPMVYPSTFNWGLPTNPSYAPAPAYPYEIVYYSVRKAVERLGGTTVRVRPWLQYFNDYAYDGRAYTEKEIVAQKKGAVEGGGDGWMLWDPTVTYSKGGLLLAGEGQ